MNASKAPPVSLGEDDIGAALISQVWKALARSPFGSSSRLWAQACVCIGPEGARVVHRLALAHELEHGDLHALAVEARNRKVPRGSCLLFVQRDDAGPEGDAFVGFVLVELAKP